MVHSLLARDRLSYDGAKSLLVAFKASVVRGFEHSACEVLRQCARLLQEDGLRALVQLSPAMAPRGCSNVCCSVAVGFASCSEFQTSAISRRHNRREDGCWPFMAALSPSFVLSAEIATPGSFSRSRALEPPVVADNRQPRRCLRKATNSSSIALNTRRNSSADEQSANSVS